MNTIKMSKRTYLVIAIIAVIVLVYVAMNQHKYDSRLPAELQPLSTRGLPVPATDVPVTLPPDPGEAGKLTLAGIDSNNDGVRDDLEREIVYMYPQNEEVRRVLRAMVKKEQDVISTTGDHDHFEALMVSYFAFEDCWDFLVFGVVNINRDYSNIDRLYTMLTNTELRYKTESKNREIAHPFAAEVGSVTACEKVQGQY